MYFQDCGRGCYRVNNGEYFNYDIAFDINHCWMRVEKDKLDTQVMRLEVEVFNSAMLKTATETFVRNILISC